MRFPPAKRKQNSTAIAVDVLWSRSAPMERNSPPPDSMARPSCGNCRGRLFASGEAALTATTGVQCVGLLPRLPGSQLRRSFPSPIRPTSCGHLPNPHTPAPPRPELAAIDLRSAASGRPLATLSAVCLTAARCSAVGSPSSALLSCPITRSPAAVSDFAAAVRVAKLSAFRSVKSLANSFAGNASTGLILWRRNATGASAALRGKRH